MYCHCCQTRILSNEIKSNDGRCPECGTVPQWDSLLWEPDSNDNEEIAEAKEWEYIEALAE